MLQKKKVNTFILYSVNYIVDKLNDSHYGRLWPGKEDRREKDTFRLVMCFKHAAITVTTKKAQHANTRSLPTVRPLRSAPGDTFGTRTSRFLEGKGNGSTSGGQSSCKAWLAGIINSHLLVWWNRSRKAKAHQAHANFSLITLKCSIGRPHYSRR